jgi:putative acetyltransferase
MVRVLPLDVIVTLQSGLSPEAIALCQLMTLDLTKRYPEDQLYCTGYFDLDKANLSNITFAIAHLGEEAVGCGAIRSTEDHKCVELKRVFVTPEARRRGVAKLIVDRLANEARKEGFEFMVLETGERQQEAISLYLSLGFRRCRCWGRYQYSSWSVCFRKGLDPNL